MTWIRGIVLRKRIVLMRRHSRSSCCSRRRGLGRVEWCRMGPEVELRMMRLGSQVLVVLEVLFVRHCAIYLRVFSLFTELAWDHIISLVYSKSMDSQQDDNLFLCCHFTLFWSPIFTILVIHRNICRSFMLNVKEFPKITLNKEPIEHINPKLTTL